MPHFIYKHMRVSAASMLFKKKTRTCLHGAALSSTSCFMGKGLLQYRTFHKGKRSSFLNLLVRLKVPQWLCLLGRASYSLPN